MKTVIYVCDRCSKSYKNPIEDDDDITYEIHLVEYGKLDLCPECKERLKIWFNKHDKTEE